MINENKSPCPYCNSPFGKLTSAYFRWGCTNNKCPEQPSVYAPVRNGSPLNNQDKVIEKINKFWDNVIKNAVKVKEKKQKELNKLTKLVNEYYN